MFAHDLYVGIDLTVLSSTLSTPPDSHCLSPPWTSPHSLTYVCIHSCACTVFLLQQPICWSVSMPSLNHDMQIATTATHECTQQSLVNSVPAYSLAYSLPHCVLCFVFCVLCFVLCVVGCGLCVVGCVVCFVFCVLCCVLCVVCCVRRQFMHICALASFAVFRLMRTHLHCMALA